MTESSPWNDISTPAEELHIRVIGSTDSYSAYWAKDSKGRPGFLLSLDGSNAKTFKDERMDFRGIEMDLRMLPESSQESFQMFLERKEHEDIFEKLCLSLIDSLNSLPSNSNKLKSVFDALLEWREIFSVDPVALKENAARGLLGELIVLESLIEKSKSHKRAIECWRGAEKEHQDFYGESGALEIKTLLGNNKEYVTISSEYQLDQSVGKLAILVIRFFESRAHGAVSLDEVAERISKRLTSTDRAKFTTKLAAAGYRKPSSASGKQYAITGLSIYEVTDGFPSLTSGDVPAGVDRVVYRLDLSKCNRFKQAFHTLEEAVDGRVD